MSLTLRTSATKLTIALLMVAGLAACNRSDRENVSQETSEAASAVGQSMENAASDASAATASAMDSASGAMNNAGQEASNAASNAGQAIDDATVTTKVKAALLADETVKGLNINVDTKDGVVTLKGNTDTAQKTRAEEIAKTVEGVKSVENQLTAK